MRAVLKAPINELAAVRKINLVAAATIAAAGGWGFLVIESSNAIYERRLDRHRLALFFAPICGIIHCLLGAAGVADTRWLGVPLDDLAAGGAPIAYSVAARATVVAPP